MLATIRVDNERTARTTTFGAYARGEHWNERVRMMQWWADYLDELRKTPLIATGDEAHKTLVLKQADTQTH
jgi:hypothetical protein